MGEEIITLESQEVEALDTATDIVAMAEMRMAKQQRLIGVALKITNPGDWIDQQGKAYLVGSGAEKVGRLFGVKVADVSGRKVDTSDENGPFYIYEYTGTFSLPGGVDSIRAIGTCSSKDQFFAKRGGKLLPLSEVDETNIMKAANTNMFVRGITQLLGLRNLTWEQLSEAGIGKGTVGKVEYKDTKAKQSRAAGTISAPQRKRLYAIACEREKVTGIPAKDLCAEAMALVCGEEAPDKTDSIAKKDYDAVVEKVQSLELVDFERGTADVYRENSQ